MQTNKTCTISQNWKKISQNTKLKLHEIAKTKIFVATLVGRRRGGGGGGEGRGVASRWVGGALEFPLMYIKLPMYL